EYIQETDIPDGLVQILTGTGSDVGNYLSQSKNVDLISITGCIGAGKSVMENAASNVKGVNLELGGKARAIVTKNADLKKDNEYIVQKKINNKVQICTCPERIYVETDVFNDFLEIVKRKMKYVRPGDPNVKETTIS